MQPHPRMVYMRRQKATQNKDPICTARGENPGNGKVTRDQLT